MCHSNKELWKRYKSKNDGRRIFQIDLALAVMEYGIKLDWEATFLDENRPAWMRKKSFVPCACETCFFCKIKKTNGMEHKPRSRKEKKRKHDDMICTTERVDIGKGSSYCRLCYRTHKTNSSEKNSASVIKKKCQSFRLGCKGCKEQVCIKCWKSYEHNQYKFSNL